MLTIRTGTKPHGFRMYNRASVEIEPGISILTGCNGSGKTTLLSYIEDYCKDNKIPVAKYDNLTDGGHQQFNNMFSFDREDIERFSAMFDLSEGELLMANCFNFREDVKGFIETGKNAKKHSKLFETLKRMSNSEEKEKEVPNIRVFLFDAIDSGLDVVAAATIRKILLSIEKECVKRNLDVYIVASANTFELCKNMRCFDVVRGRYITDPFEKYEDYHEFIISSYKRKLNREDIRETRR